MKFLIKCIYIIDSLSNDRNGRDNSLGIIIVIKRKLMITIINYYYVMIDY